MKKLFYYIIIILCPVLGPIYGQDIKVNSSFDTTSIYIGDQINFTLTVHQPKDLILITPDFKDTIIKNIEILSGPFTDSISNNDGTLLINKKYLITSFDSGYYQIPPVYAELKNENGLKRFYSDYTQLAVLRPQITPPDTTARIFDIIKPYKAPLTIGDILPWILLLAALAVIVYFIKRLLKRLRKSERGNEVIVIPDPAHIIAFRELEKLRDEKLWQKGEVKLYYTRLTEILRQYLEDRFRVYSLELTTSDTLDALLKTGFKKDPSFRKLQTVLTGADMVKFARYNPESSEHELYFQNSWEFVLSTREDIVISESAEHSIAKEEGTV